MPLKKVAQNSQALRLGILIAGTAALASAFVAWRQVHEERRIDEEDLTRRAAVLAHRLSPGTVAALAGTDSEATAALGERLEGHSRLLGFAVFRTDGRMMASGRGVAGLEDVLGPLVRRALAGEPEVALVTKAQGEDLHVLARALADPEGPTVGALVVVHDAAYLDERVTKRLLELGLWGLLLSLVLLSAVVGLAWFAYERPLGRLAGWMKHLRVDSAAEAPPPRLPNLALAEESEQLAATFRAARSTMRSLSRETVQADKVWTRERLATHAIEHLAGDQLVVVSNREPYMHQMREGEPSVIVPASGLVTALDPVLRACGGLWVAHGAGDADRETADSQARIAVPPGHARYTLRRVWLSRDEEQGYYYGFSNEGLWPLCHLTFERPVFRASDWQSYMRANRLFAAAVLEEIGSARAQVLVQDFHLALVPALLKAARPDLRVGLFWHIPWPMPEAIRICPWRVELLRGMLGADLVGFHLQQYGNNFLDTVDRMVEARLDWDRFSVDLRGHATLVRPFPISVESWSERGVPSGADLERQTAELREIHELGAAQIAVGVDRIDYTKGLPERFRAIERFFQKYPEHRGRWTFVQIGAPSRTHIRRYRELSTEIEALADEINWKLRTVDWKPIHLLAAHHDAAAVHAFLSMAGVCIVSSLHDGMNLVAKEYVAARRDGDGVLVLSEFTGAARELTDAVLINPYDTESFADALRAAVEMEPAERRARMGRMRKTVEEHSIYHWAAGFMGALAESTPEPAGAAAGGRSAG